MTRPRFISPNEVSALRTNILSKLTYAVGKDPDNALDHDWFQATALAARDYIVDRWMSRTRDAYRTGQKRVYYLSLEFLIGRLLIDSLSNLGILEETRRALATSASTWSASAGWSRTPPWVTAVSAGWPPASWKAWPPWASPAMAMASVTSMVCSAR